MLLQAIKKPMTREVDLSPISKMASNCVQRAGLEFSLDNSQFDTYPITLVVRFSGRGSYVVEATLQSTIMDVKSLLAQRTDISPSDIRLVLAGQELDDNKKLEMCGIGLSTTLHAFCHSIQGNQTISESSKPGDQTGNGDANNHHQQLANPAVALDEGSSTDPESFSQASEPRQNPQQRVPGYSRFFVHCKLCDGVRPAKLRLVCRNCGNGAFLVDRGPSNWDDISSSTLITGKCTTAQCTCTTPRFYLSCSQYHSGDVEGTSVPLKHINTNRRRIECVACEDVASHVLMFPCSAGHVICLPCFQQLCTVCLDERRFIEHPRHGYTLQCPAGCPDSFIEETHHFLLMGKDKYERYKNFGAEEFVLQNGGVLCPAPGCGMGLFPEDDNLRIRCEQCQFESCRLCHRDYHEGPCDNSDTLMCRPFVDLSITEEMAQNASWEHQSMSLIEQTTKLCPNCRVKTEHNGGCMHMICSRCKEEWCWICVKSWTRECMADHWFGE